MSTKHLLRSFAGGEITPELAGRLDLTKYQTGLSLCRNFITLPHGPAARRPGFEFINEAYNSVFPVRLIPFQFNADQTAVLEFGNYYVRFHIAGGTLLETPIGVSSASGSTITTSAAHGYTTGDWVFANGTYLVVTVTSSTTFTVKRPGGAIFLLGSVTSVARVYTVATPYPASALFRLNYAQSADTLTLVHPDHPAHELVRNGVTDWTLTPITFAPPSGVPTSVTATPTVATSTNLTQAKYVVTAVQPDGVSESLASAPATATNNLTLAGNYNTVTWVGVDGCDRYNVYKQRGGTYGFIGQVQPVAGSVTSIVNMTQGLPTSHSKQVTVNTATSHGRSTGDRVLIEGADYTWMNGYFQITVVDADTFTFQSSKKTFAVSTGGTVSIPTLSITDDNVLADTTQSPPEDVIQLNGALGDYPAATTYHEQRRWFAGSTSKPQVLWATRTGTENNLTSSIPTRDADGMELRIAAAQYNQIRHLVPLADLLALTAGGEFRVYADGAPAITPTSVSIKPQGYAGSSTVQPVVTSGSVLYVQAQGSRVRELAYNWESNAYRSLDISIMAPHRFNGRTITQLAYSRAPDQIAWAVRDDGVLLGLTYVPDQQVFAWHAHDTDGFFESVCVVSEGNEDVLYAVVRRTVATRVVRYVERLRTRLFSSASAAFFVDSGLTFTSSGLPVSVVSNLWHLEGRFVDVVVDGAVHPRKQVLDGQVTLDYPATTVHVGLPITADLRTLPLSMEGAQAMGQGTVKNVNKVHIRVGQSSVLKAGPAFDRLREYPARAVSDPYGSPPELRDGELSLSVDPSWNQDAAVCIRQDLPLPLTVLSMTLEVQSGG